MNAATPLGHRVGAIVIGASAGGVEVLSTLLPALPETIRAAVFVVLHQPPDRQSILAEIFSRKCKLPVREAEDKEPIEPGTIYFAPPNYHLLIEAGARIALSVDDLVQFSRPSIDVLFHSAADTYRERLLGILLTGWNEDGAAGLLAVHAVKGITIVQDPQSAEAPVMPQAAIRMHSPDFVLHPRAIADLLHGLEPAPATSGTSPARAAPAP
ncbi:CheB methylesterase [Panacagrimonas perspica]|uniref:protein-glutamate methylesterase n=1 Tax=Panacagrimonas perspica TaxID=381431 RepID=A0A4R7NYJ6_9GAMM|nr:chemotaxis protein CheB [Panacagrimonas perspica]TDU26405.1 CheB methylesterase [Panacagrimonas perspica]THD02039.1 chemotaxis protein CheB [Panacagrimonas perspica]